MPSERYYTSSSLAIHQNILLDPQESHHLLHVMRGREGDQVELVNGQGSLAQASVSLVKKHSATLSVIGVENTPQPSFDIVLAQAIPRINRLDTILEKATELGATQIWLFPGEKSERKTLTDHQIERSKQLTISAMKQCGRLFLPKLKILPRLEDWKSPLQNAFFGDLQPNTPLFETEWKNCSPQKQCIILIGPESGFTQNETRQLVCLHAKGVKLHQNILRTDTAPLLALSLISHWLLTSNLI